MSNKEFYIPSNDSLFIAEVTLVHVSMLIKITVIHELETNQIWGKCRVAFLMMKTNKMKENKRDEFPLLFSVSGLFFPFLCSQLKTAVDICVDVLCLLYHECISLHFPIVALFVFPFIFSFLFLFLLPFPLHLHFEKKRKKK